MPPPTDPRERARWVVTIVASIVQYIVHGVMVHIAPQMLREDLHTSALSGRAWLNELLVGHADRIYIALGMHRHVFLALVFQIRMLGYIEAQQARIELDESLAIFLYTCVTGLAIDHVAERFQHSHTTISQYAHFFRSRSKLISVLAATFGRSSTFSPPPNFTHDMCVFQQQMSFPPRRFVRTPSGGRTSATYSVPSMEPISTAPQLQRSFTQHGIAKVE